MDIISEILQTDKLADAKIIRANEKKAELEQLTHDEIADLERTSSEKVETYRAKVIEKCKKQTEAQIAKIEKNEIRQAQKMGKSHCGKGIFRKITSGSFKGGTRYA